MQGPVFYAQLRTTNHTGSTRDVKAEQPDQTSVDLTNIDEGCPCLFADGTCLRLVLVFNWDERPLKHAVRCQKPYGLRRLTHPCYQ